MRESAERGETTRTFFSFCDFGTREGGADQEGDQQVAKKCGKEEESYIFEMETAGIKLFI